MLESFSSGNWHGTMEIDKKMKQRFFNLAQILATEGIQIGNGKKHEKIEIDKGKGRIFIGNGYRNGAME